MSGKDVRSDRLLPWLKANGYDDVAQMIEALIQDWHEKGKKTRRNWWDILAGGKDGKPRTVDGVKFPILRAAQIRQGVKISDNAIYRGEDCGTLNKWEVGRWSNNRNST